MALKKITNSSESARVKSLYEKIFIDAEEKASSVPVKMGGQGNIDLLYYLSEHINATNVIETGVAYGWSSLSLLLSISKRKGKLISTDMPYAKMGNEKFVGCVVPDELKESWTIIRRPDISGLPKALKEMPSFDICHYDSDKSYRGRMWAYPKLWKHLRPGGIFISDDIGDNIAFKDFSDSVGQKPYIVNFKNQFVGVLIKTE